MKRFLNALLPGLLFGIRYWLWRIERWLKIPRIWVRKLARKNRHIKRDKDY